jgi:hypothetical protein
MIPVSFLEYTLLIGSLNKLSMMFLYTVLDIAGIIQ